MIVIQTTRLLHLYLIAIINKEYMVFMAMHPLRRNIPVISANSYCTIENRNNVNTSGYSCNTSDLFGISCIYINCPRYQGMCPLHLTTQQYSKFAVCVIGLSLFLHMCAMYYFIDFHMFGTSSFVNDHS